MEENKLWLPPTMRIIVEFITWLLLLFLNPILFLLSLISLALLNFPGDKKPLTEKTTGFAVPGLLRIVIEVNSAIMGIIAAYIWFSTLGLVFQLSITMFSFYLDFDRWGWMLGKKPMPDYVSYVHR